MTPHSRQVLESVTNRRVRRHGFDMTIALAEPSMYTFAMDKGATSAVSEDVGLRDFRAHLSSYMEQVKQGHSYTLTEHGQPVARLTPLAGASNYERLVAEGVIQPAARRRSALEPPVAANGVVSDLIGEQRQ